MTTYRIPYYPNEGKPGTSTFPVDPAALDASLTALYTAANALSVGTPGTAIKLTRETKDVGSETPSADPDARTGRKFKVKWEESVAGLNRSTTIPCADSALVPGVKTLDISSGPGLALKNALEAVGKDPDTGGSITVIGIEFID